MCGIYLYANIKSILDTKDINNDKTDNDKTNNDKTNNDKPNNDDQQENKIIDETKTKNIETKENQTNQPCAYNTPYNDISHRGPDKFTNVLIENNNISMSFYRLSIVGNSELSQPFYKDGVYVMANAEIYNHRHLRIIYGIPETDIKTGSDCEIILHLYLKIGIEKMINLFNGEFAFVIIDTNKKQIYFARDIFGIKPLYYSYFKDGLFIASELKAIHTNALHVLPRNIYCVSYSNNRSSISILDYYHISYKPSPYTNNFKIYQLLRKAVEKRIIQTNNNIEVGFLLSGGLDSSLITSLALDYYSKQNPSYKPHLYTIGFEENAPDIKSAKIMIEWLKNKYGSDSFTWHLVILPITAGINALNDVAWHLETYDTTTIRASTPMYLISQYIKQNTPNVKVIISGEGSDELFGGYLYFKYAPDDFAFRSEIIHLLNSLYLYDVLRADRTTSAFGLEIRPPFLDIELVEEVLSNLNLKLDKNITKKLLRDCIANHNLLPYQILNGKKEAFSDAVGYSWKNALTEYCNVLYSDLFNNYKLYKETNKLYNNEQSNQEQSNQELDTIKLINNSNSNANTNTNTNTNNDNSNNSNNSNNVNATNTNTNNTNNVNDNANNTNSNNTNSKELNSKELMECKFYDELLKISHIKPETVEQYHYQKIFVQSFGNQFYLLNKYWLPNQQWIKTGSEPSATILNCYTNNTNINNTN
jgi:asparagine synthase (glutamine-hydrolysing)